jgi:hypothetical protein
MDTPPTSSANPGLVRAPYVNWERGDFFAHAEWETPKSSA